MQANDPNVVEFSGLQVPRQELAGIDRLIPQPLTNTTRLEFLIADSYEDYPRVQQWLRDHCHGQFTSYVYAIGSITNCVINFEILNDAMMFKLSSGYEPSE